MPGTISLLGRLMLVMIVRKIRKTLIFDGEGSGGGDVNIISDDKKRQDYRAHLSDWTAAIRFTHKQISVMSHWNINYPVTGILTLTNNNGKLLYFYM